MSSSEPTPQTTIATVAERAGVSIATVSRVINQTAPVAEGTAARVRAAIAELNYRPSAAARGLASKKTNMVGLLTTDISTPFFTPILRGIEAGARESGFGLLIHCTRGEPSPAPRFQRPMGPHNADGLLVFVGSLTDAELTHLYEIGFPVVLLHQTPPNSLRIPYVTFENKSGTRKLIDHLIKVHGYRRIAFLRGPENQEDSHWREMGYREALAAHNIPFDPALMATGDFDKVKAQIPVKRWLREGMQIEAIFSGDDEAATGVITALQQAGKRVPEDIAVVGFDDVHLADYLMSPLTTVRAPVEQAGREAARQLVSLIRTGEAEPMILLSTELVIRRSCGCPYAR
ncbi:MAG: LacI family transcriptional regulator [Chloroflexi bacterium]|nr:LacI family transcriptional regulator [Chloroflexota bacterium]